MHWLFEVGDVPYPVLLKPCTFAVEAPYIDRATGNNGDSASLCLFPPTNVSASNPDTTFNWASTLPISGALVLDVKSVIPYTQSYYWRTETVWGKTVLV